MLGLVVGLVGAGLERDGESRPVLSPGGLT